MTVVTFTSWNSRQSSNDGVITVIEASDVVTTSTKVMESSLLVAVNRRVPALLANQIMDRHRPYRRRYHLRQ